MWETTSFRNELTDDLSGVSEAIRSMVAACFVVLRILVMGYEDRTPGNEYGRRTLGGYRAKFFTLVISRTAPRYL